MTRSPGDRLTTPRLPDRLNAAARRIGVDVGLLVVEGAVFHQVPAKNVPAADGGAPHAVHSNAESTLDPRLELFLRDRLTRTFAHAMQPVRRDENSSSVTPDLVIAALGDQGTADIVLPFQPLADLLLEVQAHNSPQGLLAVIRGSCGGQRVIVLMKVEQERGLSFETQDIDGVTRVEVVIEDGLVLTDKTEVFKAGLLFIEDDELHGFVTDDQSGSVYRGPSSHYWLSDFLGCEWANDVDVMTRNWIKGIQRLIKSDVSDPAQKSALTAALHAELTSNRANIMPRTFIEDHVPQDLQDRAIERLRDAGVPNRRFKKSRTVANASPSTKRIVFNNGVMVTMPVDAEPEISQSTVDGDTQDVLTIRGKISRVE